MGKMKELAMSLKERQALEYPVIPPEYQERIDHYCPNCRKDHLTMVADKEAECRNCGAEFHLISDIKNTVSTIQK